MKRAIIMIWSRPFGFHTDKSSGLLKAAINLADEISADLVWIKPSERIKKTDKYHPAFEFLTVDEFLERDYDFAVLTTAGNMNDYKSMTRETQTILGTLDRFPSFAVWAHNEVEPKHLPFREQFYNHKNCTLRMAITEDIGQAVFGDRRFIVYSAHKKIIHPRDFYNRRRLVSMTCRLTSRKTVIPFITEASPALIDDGWSVEVYGPASSYFYAKQVEEIAAATGVKYHGPTADVQTVHRQSAFNANLPYLKNGNFSSRLELATTEAIEQGCAGVVLDETTPVDARGLVKISRFHLSDLAVKLRDTDRVSLNAEFAAYHNERGAEELARLERALA